MTREEILAVYVIIVVLLALGCHQKEVAPEAIAGEPTIQVLLSEVSGKAEVQISTSGPYQILDADLRLISKGKQLSPKKITLQAQNISLGDQKFDRQFYLKVEENGQVIVENRPYYGDLHCMNDGGKLQIVNVLPMEKYLCCVLGGEMPLSSPPAALQAQAIAARTYALYEKTHNENRNFDVYDTVQSQVYRGVEMETPYASGMVQKTRGMVLLYQNALFKTFFHSTCGGHTARAADVFEYADITPLSGVKCPFCTGSKYYQWEYRADMSELNLMVSNFKLAPPFRGFGILQQDRSERFSEIEVHYGQNEKKVIKASDIRKTLGTNKLRSTRFTIQSVENGILFQGWGWGHGVGLCQMGAIEMAKPKLTEDGRTKPGFSALDILKFYYPLSQPYRLWE